MPILFFVPRIALGQSTSTVQLPAGFTAGFLGIATDTLSNFSGYITIVIGVLLSVVVIEILIGAIRKH